MNRLVINRNAFGFTLIELMVIVAIIGITGICIAVHAPIALTISCPLYIAAKWYRKH